ncbi:MAG: SUF system NifU family Fe-S cluster assembly protein [Gammaproteobacteria bacterium]|nr:MAG: SUF system NifU family Fe-S cluster assembly protein [Gammaproteobacteria bacterium]
MIGVAYPAVRTLAAARYTLRMTAAAPYHQLVLEHSRAPRRFGALEHATHTADGANPLCGDALHVDVRVTDGRIADLRFRGEACALVRASASMLGERAIDLDAVALAQLEADFARLVAGALAQEATLGDLNAFAALAQYPSRRKCALLPFATLRAALAGHVTATTESKPPESSLQEKT